jgi:hypothetical protein
MNTSRNNFSGARFTRWLPLFAGMLTMKALALIGTGAQAAQGGNMLSVLGQFENAPITGPDEAAMPVRPLPDATNLVSHSKLPGEGLAQHPFLYYGEGNNVLYVVNHGRVVWTYVFPTGGEIDDAWMLSNGHIICTTMNHCYEVTPDKKIVWSYDCPTNTQIHALQPVGLDQVMIVENGLPPHLYILNKKDNSKALTHELTVTNTTDPRTVHTQFRNCRITAQGTYLLPYLAERRIVEYDKDWKEIWNVKSEACWSAVRLKNGNTLVPGDNRAFVRELNPKGEVVWAIEKNDLPGIELRGIQTVNRLDNGNTVFCNRGGSNTNRFGIVQVIEVTPDKKVVWALRDWTALGSATGIQLLDQSGTPEKPGDLKR